MAETWAEEMIERLLDPDYEIDDQDYPPKITWPQKEVMMFNKEIPATRENLHCGDHVAFEFRGQRFEGLFVTLNKRATVVVPRHGKFYIPLRMLWKVKHE